MTELPKRKPIRIADYDYSTPGAYFITVCVANRKPILWNVGAVGHMKRWVSMQIGYSIWQKSFIDRVIRNDKGYRAVWKYIENNPIKLDTAYNMPDFENM